MSDGSKGWNPRRARPVLRRFCRYVFAWVALTLLSACLHETVMNPASPLAGGQDWWTGSAILFANMIVTLLAPVHLVVERWPKDGLASIVVFFGVGWAGWLIALWIVMWFRGFLLGRAASAEESAGAVGLEIPHLQADATPGNESAQPKLSRRRLLVDGALGAGALAIPGATAYGGIYSPLNFRIVRYTMEIDDLPAEFEGLRLVQISDTHVGNRIPDVHLRGVVRAAAELRPDVFLLTGDYIHGRRAYIPRGAAIFEPITSGPLARPTVGVLGNHDWLDDGPAMARALRALGVRMVDNDRVFLSPARRLVESEEDPGGHLCLAGLGDLTFDRTLPQRSLRNVRSSTPRLVLAHQPDSAEEPGVAMAGRIDAIFSGHTHGGQCKLPFIGAPVTMSRYGQKYLGGIVNSPSGRVVVSRGVGVTWLTLRINVPPELVEVTLRRAERSARGTLPQTCTGTSFC